MNARTKARTIAAGEARRVGEEIGIGWASAPFDVEQFRMGWRSSWSTASTIL